MRSLPVVTLVHFTANAVLLSVGYYWLGVGESRTSTLLWSILIAVLFLLFAACAYAAPLAYFREPGAREIGAAWRSGVRNLLPFLVAAAIIGALVIVLNRAGATAAPGVRRWAI